MKKEKNEDFWRGLFNDIKFERSPEGNFNFKLISNKSESRETRGVEYDHRISYVQEESQAELAGLSENMRVLRVNKQWIGQMEHNEVAQLIKKTAKALALRVVHSEADPDYKERDEKLVEKGYKFLLVEKKKGKGLGLNIETEMEATEGNPRWKHIVVSVDGGSVADSAGFSPGHIIVRLNGFDLSSYNRREFTSIAQNFMSNEQISFIVAIPDFERRESSSSEELSEPPSKRGKRISEGRYSLDEIQNEHITVDGEEDVNVTRTAPVSVEAETVLAEESLPVAAPRVLPRANDLPKARLLRLVKSSTGSYGISMKTDPEIGLHCISLVAKSQPGALAGLLVDDCIWEINGEPVSKADSVKERMQKYPHHVVLLVTSKTEAKWFLDAGSRPDEFLAEKWALRYGESGIPREVEIFAGEEKMGFAFKSAATDKENNFGEHFITSVTKDGLAHKAGMEEEDVIIIANGTNTETLGHEEVISVIKSSMNPVKLTLINRKLNQAYKRLLINPADTDLIRELNKFELKTEPTISIPPPSYSQEDKELTTEEVIEEIAARQTAIPETEKIESQSKETVKRTKTRESEREHRKNVVLAQQPRIVTLNRTNSSELIGFEYSSDKQNHHFVSTIYEETAADIAGLLTNDRILEINSEEVSGYSREEVDKLLNEDTNVELLVVDEATLITLEERGIKITAQLARGIDEPEAIKTSGATVSRAASTKIVPLPNTPKPLPRLVLLKKKNQTFGIEIGTEDDKFGASSHRLISIASSGPAAKTSARIGDYLLEINEIPVAGKNHDDLKLLIQNAGKRMVLLLADLESMDWHFDRQRMIDPSDAVQIPLAEFDSSESETEASSIDSFDFAGGRKIAPVTPTNQVTKMDESSSESSDEEPPRKPSREVRRTVLVSKSPTPPPPKEPTPSPKSPTPAPVEKTPPPPPIKSPTPPLIVESRAQTSQTRVLTPVDFDSDPEPLPEPEPSSDEERPPVAPPAPPALSAFKPAPEVRESEVMGVPKSKDVPSISYIAAQAAEAANKRSLKKADGEIDTSTGNYGLDFARNEKKFGTVKRFKIPNHRKPKIDIFGEPAKPQPEHNPPQTVNQAQGMNQRGSQGKPYAYHSSGSQFQGMLLHSSNQQNVPPRSYNRAPSAQPSQMAPSVVGQALPPQSYPQRGYYDDSTAHRRFVQQPIHQPAPIPENPGHFRNHIPQYAQPPINEQMAPPPQNYYPAASYAPQDHAFTVPQQQYNRPYEYHQPAPPMHTANVLPNQTVGYAPSVVDQRSVSQAPPHQTNDKVIQYVIQLPRIHDQSVHAAGPAPQIIIK